MTAGRRTSQLTAVLDANVLYPAPLRDFFMWLAANHVFTARWTDERHIEGLELPDPDDRHVLAAAIECDAAYIVTGNLGDFPDRTLIPYGVEAVGPDEFAHSLLQREPRAVAQAAREHRESLTNPPKSRDEYLDTLRRRGLARTSRELEQHL